MFVEITKKENNSPTGMDALFKKQRDNGGITPEFAMEVLESTNHYGNIKQIAKHILSLEAPEERLAYKEFVVSSVYGRETTPEGFRMLYTLACDGGYDKEFFEAYNKPKEYTKDYCSMKTINFARVGDECISENLREYDRLIIDYSEYKKDMCSEICQYGCKENWFQNAKALSVRKDNDGYIDAVRFRFDNIERLNFSTEDDVKLVDFIDCDNVDFRLFTNYTISNNDLKLNLKNVNYFSMSKSGGSKNINIDIRYENVDTVVLYGVSLKENGLGEFDGVKKLKLVNCKDFPEVFDISNIDDVYMSCSGYSDINLVKEIKFKEGAKVCIMPETEPDPDGFYPVSYYNIEIPAHIDFSKCSEVTLGGSLAQYDTLSFGDGAKVYFEEVTKFPQVLDVSMCAGVNMSWEELNMINEIIVRDREQLEDIVKISRKDEAGQKLFLSRLKKKAKFVNEEKSVSFLSRLWEIGS